MRASLSIWLVAAGFGLAAAGSAGAPAPATAGGKSQVETALLRIWLPLHVALAGVALALLVIHLVEVLR